MKALGSCLALLCLVTACNEKPPIQTVRQPDGSWRVKCQASLVKCADQAEAICKDRGLTLLSGRSEHKLYGHETGASQVEVRSSELLIKCVERKGGTPDEIAAAPMLVRPDSVDAPAPAPAAAPPAHACIPGATQRCVGAAACAGGQVCLPDGSAFGACDCGNAASAPAAAPVAPSAPAPAGAPAPLP